MLEAVDTRNCKAGTAVDTRDCKTSIAVDASNCKSRRAGGCKARSTVVTRQECCFTRVFMKKKNVFERLVY